MIFSGNGGIEQSGAVHIFFTIFSSGITSIEMPLLTPCYALLLYLFFGSHAPPPPLLARTCPLSARARRAPTPFLVCFGSSFACATRHASPLESFGVGHVSHVQFFYRDHVRFALFFVQKSSPGIGKYLQEVNSPHFQACDKKKHR